MSNQIKDIEYQEKVNCNFAESVYIMMATRRYGLKFCCDIDLQRWSIKKELLELNDIKDAEFTITDCPAVEFIIPSCNCSS